MPIKYFIFVNEICCYSECSGDTISGKLKTVVININLLRWNFLFLFVSMALPPKKECLLNCLEKHSYVINHDRHLFFDKLFKRGQKVRIFNT